MSELKGLRIKNSISGKVLTTNGNGIAISSNVDITDIASASNLASLENRVSNIEGNVQTIANNIVAINGETIV